MSTVASQKNILCVNNDKFELVKNANRFVFCVRNSINLIENRDMKFNRAHKFHDLYRFFEVNECYWINHDSLKKIICEKLNQAVKIEEYRNEENLDYLLNFQCKYGWKNYCIATTLKNIRCRRDKKHGEYCTQHHKRNNILLRKLTKYNIREISTLIVHYL